MLRSITLVAAAAFVLSMISPLAEATILTYNIDNNPSGTRASNASLITVHPGYGDNVNSLSTVSGAFIYNYEEGNGFTPDITVDYGIVAPATSHTYYSDGDGALSPLWKDVDFLIGTGGALFRWTFTPTTSDAGVQVNSFDVFGYNVALAHTVSWTLRQDSAVGAILASGGVHTLTTETFASPFHIDTFAPAYFGTVVLEINHLTGNGGGFAMDSLNFDQIGVPEPSSFLLLGLGTLGLVRHTRRRRRRA